MRRRNLGIACALVVAACGKGEGAKDDDPFGMGGGSGTGASNSMSSGGEDSGSEGVGGSSAPSGGAFGLGGEGMGGLGGLGSGGQSSGGQNTGGMGTGGAPLLPQGEVCSSDGWCWMAPLSHGHSFRAIARSGDELWAVGEDGVIVREDAEGFTTLHYPGLRDFNDVAFVGQDVWMVGEDGLIVKESDGVFSEIEIESTFDIRAIRVFGPQDVWIGGGNTANWEATLLHFDGEDFTDYSGEVNSVYSIGGTSSSDLYVGSIGASGSLRHFDGETWTYESGLHLQISGQRRFTDIEMHDGKVYVSSDYTDGFLWIKDAGVWSKLSVGETYPVWSLSSDGTTLWVGGEHGLFAIDGDTPSTVFSQPAFERTSIAVDSTGGEVTVGLSGGRLRRSSGGEFSTIYGSEWAGIGEDGVFSVDAVGDVTWIRNSTIESTGETWFESPLPYPNESIGLFEGAEGTFALNGTDVYLRDGTSWDLQFTGVDDFYEGWQAPNGEMFVVGRIRTAHYDGDAWEELSTVVGGYNVHGSAADNVWTVGSREIHHFDGEEWTYMFDHEVMGTDWLTAVYVAGPESVWVGGSDGILYHYDGMGWTPHPTGTGRWIFDIVGLGDDDIWAVGGAHVYHFDGLTWTIEEVPTSRELYDLDIQDEDNVWAAGRGTLLRWQRPE